MGNFTHDVIILGHGLAGAVLVHHLRQKGARVHVFDNAQINSASKAAAGAVNPISLRRDVLTWRAPEMLEKVQQFHTSFEELHAVRVWKPIELIKIFPTPAEADQWERAMGRGGTSAFLKRKDEPELAINGIGAPHGYGTVEKCGWLDLRMLLKTQREWLLRNGYLTQKIIGGDQLQKIRGGVRIDDVAAPWIVHCSGPFGKVPGLVPVKGEVLTVKIPQLRLSRMIHRGIFILPIGDQHFKIGATFQWNDVWGGPSAEARDHLLARLQSIIPYEYELIEHAGGVRPTSKDRRPLMGAIKPHHAIFNGLGSRGVMLAPWCAEHLIAHLLDGHALDPEVDLQRFNAL